MTRRRPTLQLVARLRLPFHTIDPEADTRIFGRDVGRDTSAVGLGVHPFGDPNLGDDFEQASAAIDAREFHDYAAEWTSSGVTFLIDGEQVRTVAPSGGARLEGTMIGWREPHGAPPPACSA